MKVLIWLGCALVYGLIVTFSAYCGITLAGLPSALIAGLLIVIARNLCRRTDARRASKEAPQNSEDQKSKHPNAPPSPQTTSVQETIYFAKAANGLIVRVPESKLDAWMAEQERIKNGTEAPETVEIKKQLKERIVRDIYGSKPIEEERSTEYITKIKNTPTPSVNPAQNSSPNSPHSENSSWFIWAIASVLLFLCLFWIFYVPSQI